MGATGDELATRLVPDYTLAGLEKRLRPDPKDANALLLDEAIPLAKLCSAGKKYVSVEFVGQGNLQHSAQILVREPIGAGDDPHGYAICAP